MSGFTRTLRKRALKRLGYHRKTVTAQDTKGVPVTSTFIADKDGNKVGNRWP